MSTALACPLCGHRHRRPTGPDAPPTFRCESCSTLLKVPVEDPVEEADGPSPLAGPSTPAARRPMTPPAGSAGADDGLVDVPAGREGPGDVADRVPTPVRVLVWLGALPLGLVGSVMGLRLVGVLRADRIVDLVLGAGPGRFAWVALLVPVWAALAALPAHLVLEGLARRRRRRRASDDPPLPPHPDDGQRRGSRSTLP